MFYIRSVRLLSCAIQMENVDNNRSVDVLTWEKCLYPYNSGKSYLRRQNVSSNFMLTVTIKDGI